MRSFFIFIVKIFLLVVVVLFGLEFTYTSAFNNKTVRSKVQFVIKNRNLEYDVIALGSSRANNHIVTDLFNKKGLKAYNFGMSGATLEESYVLLKLLLENSKVKHVLLEVDLNINTETYSKAHRIDFLPYITTNSLVDDYYKDKIIDYNLYKNIPFYKYMAYDSRIGFREFSLNLINKKSKHLDYGGFSPLFGTSKSLSYNISTYSPKKNKYYNLIKNLCEKKNVDLISFSTPMCNQAIGMDYFNKINVIYPEIINLESVVKEDKYFSTCGHMNVEGATLFTNFLIKKFF